ncbi:unnamed protein product [Thelazia callipaeda]|uniref:Replication stress response regulator SDE2 n=1 Tax=Thelazia callipaeda TaxID=103827 RepID=A0A0N5D3D5_THECL|nr:unnamed protein product [Thelazia callipaeda]
MNPTFRTIAQLSLLPKDSFYVTVNGKVVDWENLDENIPFQVHFRLRGGKGGFGSLLRSFRIHRSTNQLMCRDLSGRRLADIKEEERLRKWIQKASEREEEKRRQKQEKYEKLKGAPRKHDFHDPEFIATREKILEETDEAFEAGVAVAKSKKMKGIASSKPEESKVAENRNLEQNILHKRKQESVENTNECKKLKLENEKDDVLGDSSSQKCAATTINCAVENSLSSTINKFEESSLPKKKDTVSKVQAKAADFENVDLTNYDSAKQLESLGLDHLKHALQVRGLKCGGSLSERALRLYSVKNLEPEDYPKSIRAGSKKK